MLPILGLGEDFSCAGHKGAVSVGVALKRVHEPRGGIAEIPVDTHDAGLRGGAAIGLACYVVVVGADECSFQLGNAGGDGIVEGGERRTFEGWQGLNVGRLNGSEESAKRDFNDSVASGLRCVHCCGNRLQDARTKRHRLLLRATIASLRPRRFCWKRRFLSVVRSRSNPAS